MFRNWKGLMALMCVALISSGCASMSERQKGFMKGAAVGAVIGGGSGAAIGSGVDDSNRDSGAVIGIAAGAIVGGIVGAMLAKEPAAPEPECKKPEPPKPASPPPPPAPAPKPAPAPAPVKEKVVLRGINFDLDKANIKPEFVPVLEEGAKILKSHSGVKVEIQGHTCALGTDQYNQKLSEKRAKSVNDFLVSNGVDSKRLNTVGYGESKPIADNNTDAGRRMNRRVEFSVQGQ